MSTVKCLAALGLVVAAAPALADNRETQQKNYELFSRHAGPQIEEIRQFRFNRWQQLGDSAIAVWSNPGEMYIIEVDAPCNGLDWARNVGVSSTQRVVSVRFDYVTYDRNKRCQIVAIRPVDEKAVKAEMREDEEARRQ
jgi:hypothetical protein